MEQTGKLQIDRWASRCMFARNDGNLTGFSAQSIHIRGLVKNN